MLSSGREYFYPRSPYGERRIILRNRISLSADFYPRSPYGERRSRSFLSMSKVWISIHALLTESDDANLGRHRSDNDFYPRSPYGERPRVARTPTTVVTISIHALLTESDITEGSICFDSSISIHALLTESDGFGSAVLILIL